MRSARGLAATLLALSACGEGPAPAGPPRGVVLVLVDTLRADHLGAYGYERDTSPRIDALAADAVLFEDALAPSPWTLPSLATLMTGLPPTLHGARTPSDVGALDWMFRPDAFRPVTALHEGQTTLAEILKEEGFATLGLVDGSYPSAVFGFAQGFDRYDDNASPGFRFQIEEALRWLDATAPDRFFIYLHTTEVHAPYTPIEIKKFPKLQHPEAPMAYYEEAVREERERFEGIDFDPGYTGHVDGSRRSLKRIERLGRRLPPRDRQQLVSLYDRGIAYTDYWIGRLFDALAERELVDELVLIVTSDHGEEFLEHGRLEHSYSYYEEMLRIPLVMRVPGEGAGRRVAASVGLVDVLPTVLDVLGIETSRRFQGRSLRPLWRGGSLPPRDHLAEASFRSGARALRTPAWKYILNPKGQEELYDLRADPHERVNRCTAEAAACADLRRRLDEREAALARVSEELALPAAELAKPDAATRQQLRELGYAE